MEKSSYRLFTVEECVHWITKLNQDRAVCSSNCEITINHPLPPPHLGDAGVLRVILL